MVFKHLENANQTYFEHFKDSFTYFILSLKASYYFLAHAIYPDIYETSGSSQIYEIYSCILDKYKKIENKDI